ncbi:MAG TPA: response regulator [Thermoanaerobaculia bacterium]|nr:response regulator [Thermoanaerobaculia bacterium]
MPKKILLADDSITIQKVVELTFSDGDYEVTAVNNGAKAVAKLAEMRPDIILSDIIMPEKNGYEVCEYVKSHPDFRNIPVVLLTGTFEPFDPDRAEKAGCDAVVTKPFESQSLIHKVEELIAQSQSAPAAAEPEPAASPWMEETPAPESSAFSTASGGFPATGSDAYTHDADIFAAPPPPQATTEMPFDTPPESPFGAPPPAEEFSGETRAFPRMSFEEMQQMATGSAPPPPPPAAPEPPPAPEPSPWDETPAVAPSFRAPSFEDPDFNAPKFEPPSYEAPSYEPPSFDAPSFNESASFSPSAPEPEADSPFGAPPPAEEFSGETRAFPRMSFEEMQQMATGSAPPPPPAPEPPPAPSPWDEQEAPAFGGETRAFPKMSFEEMQQMASSSTPPPPPEPEVSPWGEPEAPAFGTESSFAEEPPAFSGETRAFPKLSFDDFQSSQPAAPEPEPVPSLWSDSQAEPAWSLPETEEPEGPAAVESFPAASAPFGEPASAPFNEPPEPLAGEAVPEDLPFAAETASEPELEPVESLMTSEVPEEPEWEPAATAAAEPEEPAVAPAALAPEAPPMVIARSSDLTDEQIDRIARRVIELMSDQVVRNIAWEVIPDLAEMVVKERIRQLEAEA